MPWMLLGHPFRVPILDPVNGLWEPLNNFENFPVNFLIISGFVFVFYLYFYFKLEIATKVNSINVMFFLLSLLLQVSSLFLFIIF